MFIEAQRAPVTMHFFTRVAPLLGPVAPHLAKVAPHLAQVAPHLTQVAPHLDQVALHLAQVAHWDPFLAGSYTLVPERDIEKKKNERLHFTCLRTITSPHNQPQPAIKSSHALIWGV